MQNLELNRVTDFKGLLNLNKGFTKVAVFYSIATCLLFVFTQQWVRTRRGFLILNHIGGVLRQEKDVSLFLDRTGEPATQHRDSSRLKIKTRPFLDQGLAQCGNIVGLEKLPRKFSGFS